MCKKHYFETALYNNRNTPRKTWDLLEEATNLRREQSKIDQMNVENKTVTGPAAISNMFNDFFYELVQKSLTQS
jgi:hypothetical protein